jgi:predicted DNA-binding protein (UPF0251 family)
VDPALLDELPIACAVALRLEDLGLSDEQAAYALGIEAEALGPLREMARRRLARLLDHVDKESS